MPGQPLFKFSNHQFFMDANYEDAVMPEEPAEEVNQEPELREESDAPSTILPRSFFEAAGKDPEPGAICRVRVIAAHEDSVEVEYESDDAPEEDVAMAPAPPAGMSAMLE